MTKRDFFIVIIKLFGLYALVTSAFTILPSTTTLLTSVDFTSIVILCLILVVLVGLFVFLVFKSDKIVDLLKLDKGFDEDRIDFGNIDSTLIIKLATILIGGTIFLNNLSTFIHALVLAFKSEATGIEFDYRTKYNLVVNGINILIGYLLLTNYKLVAKFLTKNEQNV